MNKNPFIGRYSRVSYRELFSARFLYALYTCDISENNLVNVETVEFADDIMVCDRRGRKSNKNSIEIAINSIKDNLIKLGLSLEPKKIVLVKFSKSRYVGKNMYIKINDTRIYI